MVLFYHCIVVEALSFPKGTVIKEFLSCHSIDNDPCCTMTMLLVVLNAIEI